MKKMSMPNDEAPNVAQHSPWADDLLDRKPYADFLTQYLLARTRSKKSSTSHPYCLALDANWGEGKSFFLTNWAEQLRDTRHPVFLFDAWKADFHADPLIAFLAAFRDFLRGEIEDRLIGHHQAQILAKRSLDASIRTFRAAVLPVGKALLSGALKKFVGSSIDELSNAILDKDSGEEPHPSADENAITSGITNGVNVFFDKALEDQASRQALFDRFRVEVSTAIDALSKHGAADQPIFIFIDELDRCRPNFAIELLEALKHIFRIDGLCYIVATNMRQLGHAVGAVYGSRFDGRNYLTRFFDIEYTLPQPSLYDYVEQLINEDNILASRTLYLGTPMQGFDTPYRPGTIATVIEWVCHVFELDLRNQQRLIEIVRACAVSAPEEERFHVLWASALTASHLVSTEIYDRLRKRAGLADDFARTFATRFPRDTPRSFTTEQGGSARTTLRQLIMHTHQAVLRHIQPISYRGPEEGLEAQISAAVEGTGHITAYPEMIQLAGHIRRG